VTPGLVPLTDDLAKPQPPLLHLLGLGSHLLLGRRSLFSSRPRLYPRQRRCLRLQLIAERPKVLKLSKRDLEWQGRPSRGTPTPPGYGYLTRHLPPKATHARLSSLASRQASPSARNEEETRLHAQIPRCSGLDSRNEQTLILRVPLQTELRFHSRGYEQPPHERAYGITNSGWLAGDRCTNSAATTSVSGGKTAAATASGQTLLLKGPRSPPLTGDENQPLKPKSRRPGAQVALTVSPAEATTAAVRSLSSGNHHLSTDDSGHLPTNTAPASGGHPKAHRQVLTPVLATRTRTGPSQNTSTALAAYGVLCDPPVQPATVARVEDGQLHPVLAATVRLPPHGWRMPPPQSWSMPFSHERQRKKRVASPRKGRLQIGAPPSPARMMKILEAEGGAKAAARLASPHHKADDHPCG
jgi:hypothetical protein